MKRFFLLLTLAAFTACAGTATDQEVMCPQDQNKQLTRAEWEACYGYQDHDSGGPDT